MSADIDNIRIIKYLDHYGHLRHPFGGDVSLPFPVDQLTLSDDAVRDAVRSFQAMNHDLLTDLVKKHHGRSVANIDGDIGPATRELLSLPRCGEPDYRDDDLLVAPAVGSGNWKRCHGIGEYHCAVVAVKTAIPAFLQPVWDQVWERVVNAFAEVGLLYVRNDAHPKPNVTMHFVRPTGNWLGLAEVSNNSTCDSRTLWAQFDNRYQPADLIVMWFSLVSHEFIHNCGIGHLSNGIMSPYLTALRPFSFRSDQVWSHLASRFGGQAVPRQPPNSPRKMVLAWQDANGKYEWIADVPEYTGGGPFAV